MSKYWLQGTINIPLSCFCTLSIFSLSSFNIFFLFSYHFFFSFTKSFSSFSILSLLIYQLLFFSSSIVHQLLVLPSFVDSSSFPLSSFFSWEISNFKINCNIRFKKKLWNRVVSSLKSSYLFTFLVLKITRIQLYIVEINDDNGSCCSGELSRSSMR